MSDRIAVLNAGCVEQYADPETIYHHPATEFVARFVGRSNWLNGCEMFRPEAASQAISATCIHYTLPVKMSQYLGSSYEVTLQYHDVTWIIHSSQKHKPGEQMSIYIDPKQIITFQRKEVLSA